MTMMMVMAMMMLNKKRHFGTKISAEDGERGRRTLKNNVFQPFNNLKTRKGTPEPRGGERGRRTQKKQVFQPFNNLKTRKDTPEPKYQRRGGERGHRTRKKPGIPAI